MKRIISLILCFLVIINFFPVTVFAEEEQNLEEIIRPQIEAFAKSIDKPNASGEMEKAIISHGMTGKGKKLSVGKSHAITATLMNSELVKEALPYFLSEILKAEKNFNIDEIYCCGPINWTVSKERTYYILLYDYDFSSNYTYDSEKNFYAPNDYFHSSKKIKVKKSNKYDDSLIFIAGGLCAEIVMRVDKNYDDKTVYKVDLKFKDIFNFDTDNGSILEDLLGAFGMLLFKPFEWEAKVDFKIEIPIEKPEENITFGDADGNGKVDVADAYFARLAAAKLVKPTEEQITFCDVDGDGKITAIDANIIRKFALGIIGKLPLG